MASRKSPLVAVDGVVISGESILLITRKNEPFKGRYALPGGFVEYGEAVEEACKREVKEETGLDVEIVGLVGVYSDPNRDPRGHVISIAFLCRPIKGKPVASSDAARVQWIGLKEVLEGRVELAFDHSKIIRDAVERFKIKI